MFSEKKNKEERQKTKWYIILMQSISNFGPQDPECTAHDRNYASCNSSPRCPLKPSTRRPIASSIVGRHGSCWHTWARPGLVARNRSLQSCQVPDEEQRLLITYMYMYMYLYRDFVPSYSMPMTRQLPNFYGPNHKIVNV